GATGAAANQLHFPRKRKRSRWNQDSLEQKTVIPGMPTVIPPGLTREQERAYIGNALGGKTAPWGSPAPGAGSELGLWGQSSGFRVRAWGVSGV
uniref:Splicing factor 1 n=1 Tax=Serinus canaria TaxID=9135 RepID=A0A8C9L533_SERCA